MQSVGSYNSSCNVGQTCDMTGQIPHVDQPQTWTAPQTLDSLTVGSETINGVTFDSVPTAVYSAFLPGGISTAYTAATFTPSSGIIVTRIEVTLKTSPDACSANAVVRINGSQNWDLILASSYTDSGPIDLPMNAGNPIDVLVETPAQGCVSLPRDANVEVTYRVQ